MLILKFQLYSMASFCQGLQVTFKLNILFFFHRKLNEDLTVIYWKQMQNTLFLRTSGFFYWCYLIEGKFNALLPVIFLMVDGEEMVNHLNA